VKDWIVTAVWKDEDKDSERRFEFDYEGEIVEEVVSQFFKDYGEEFKIVSVCLAQFLDTKPLQVVE